MKKIVVEHAPFRASESFRNVQIILFPLKVCLNYKTRDTIHTCQSARARPGLKGWADLRTKATSWNVFVSSYLCFCCLNVVTALFLIDSVARARKAFLLTAIIHSPASTTPSCWKGHVPERALQKFSRKFNALETSKFSFISVYVCYYIV